MRAHDTRSIHGRLLLLCRGSPKAAPKPRRFHGKIDVSTHGPPTMIPALEGDALDLR